MADRKKTRLKIEDLARREETLTPEEADAVVGGLVAFPGFGGGVSVAGADVNGDGRPEALHRTGQRVLLGNGDGTS